MQIISWKQALEAEMEEYEETFEDVESSTLTQEELEKTFDADFGGTNGKPFTVWTKARVYFPVQYDGAEWVASVSRNPDGNPTCHIGGG